MSRRLDDLDRAKGLAILLVVFGHLVARETPAGAGWYDPLRIAVYSFHMPFFMYLSGYVAHLPGARVLPWPELARRRAARLLLPFAAFGVAVVLGKAALSGSLAIDHAPLGPWAGLRDLVWSTRDSAAGSVWYLAVLFVYSVAAPPALRALGGRLWLLGLAALALYVLPAPPYLYLDRVCTYFVFYVAGGFAAQAGGAWLAWSARWRAPLSIGFAIVVALTALWAVPRFGFAGFPYKAWLLAAGLLSMPVLHGAVRAGAASRSAALLWLGGYSFAIYLLNTICIGAVKAALVRVVSWDGPAFLPFACVLMLAGTLGPVAVKALVLRRIPAADRATS